MIIKDFYDPDCHAEIHQLDSDHYIIKTEVVNATHDIIASSIWVRRDDMVRMRNEINRMLEQKTEE